MERRDRCSGSRGRPPAPRRTSAPVSARARGAESSPESSPVRGANQGRNMVGRQDLLAAHHAKLLDKQPEERLSLLRRTGAKKRGQFRVFGAFSGSFRGVSGSFRGEQVRGALSGGPSPLAGL